MKPFLDLRGVAKQKLSTIATNLYLEQRSDFFQSKMPPENTPWTHLPVSYLEQIKILSIGVQVCRYIGIGWPFAVQRLSTLHQESPCFVVP